jgi:low affinity Fe/Cu permease
MPTDATEDTETHAKWRRGMFSTSGGRVHATDWARRHWSSRLLHRVGDIVSHATSGVVAAVLVGVFVIQHTQQRQTAATQRKLDELLRSSEQADSTVIAVEEAPDEDLDELTRSHVAEREHAQTAE